MRRLGWYALSAAVTVFVLGSLVLLAANLYVQSHGVQQRIRNALAATLRRSISLRKTTVTPWDGIRLDGLALHAVDASRSTDNPADLLTAASFRVRLAWWPLLTQHRLIISEVLLDHPALTVREEQALLVDQDVSPPESAKVPSDARPPRTAAATASVAPPTEDPDTTLPDIEQTTPSTPIARSKIVLLPIGKMRVRHGEAFFQDHEGRPYFQIDEIDADGVVPDPQHAHGALWFTRAAGAASGPAITDYWTAFDYDENAGLAVRDGHGNVAGGLLTTDFRLQPQADRWAFATRGKLENAALGQLTRPSAEQLPLAEGQMHGNMDLHGFLDDPASIAGGGRFWLEGAKLYNFPLLKIVGQVLRIADLSQLEFKQAQIDYRMENNVLHVDGLKLVSNDSRAELHGQYRVDEDQLDLHGRLTIDHAISHQLPQFIESNFMLCGDEAPGCRYLDFDVTGTRDDPKCNLYDRLTAGPMKSLLDNLMGPKPKNPKHQRQDAAKKTRSTPDTLPLKP